MKSAGRLTERQRIFAEQFVATDNAYQSALAAGYAEVTARNKSYLMPAEPKIAAHIAQLREEVVRDLLRPDRLITSIANIAFADYADIFEVVGGKLVLKDTRDIPKSKRGMVAGVRRGKKHTEVKLYNSQRAQELLVRIAGMLNNRGAEAAEVEDLTPLAMALGVGEREVGGG